MREAKTASRIFFRSSNERRILLYENQDNKKDKDIELLKKEIKEIQSSNKTIEKEIKKIMEELKRIG